MSLNWSTLGHPAPDIKCYMSRRKIWVHGHFFSNDQWPVSVSPQGSTTMHYNQSLTHSHTTYSHYIILQHFQPVDTSLEAKMVEPRSTENCLNQIFFLYSRASSVWQFTASWNKRKKCHRSILSSHPGTSFLQNLKQTNKNSINQYLLCVTPKTGRSKGNIMSISHNW